MYYLNWEKDSKEMLIVELSEEIFDECGVAENFVRTTSGAPRPIYAGFFGGELLVITVNYRNAKEVIFWGDNYWSEDEDLKKFLVLFYVEKGIYPSFKEDDRKLVMKLSKI